MLLHPGVLAPVIRLPRLPAQLIGQHLQHLVGFLRKLPFRIFLQVAEQVFLGQIEILHVGRIVRHVKITFMQLGIHFVQNAFQHFVRFLETTHFGKDPRQIAQVDRIVRFLLGGNPEIFQGLVVIVTVQGRTARSKKKPASIRRRTTLLERACFFADFFIFPPLGAGRLAGGMV